MKAKKLLCMMCLVMLTFTACGNKDSVADDTMSGTNVETEAGGEDTAESETLAPTAASARMMIEQGNPTEINLVDIVEGDGELKKAWIKVSTAYDPTLSVYSYDLIPENTVAFVVDLEVKNMDCGEQTLYWCYQVATANGTVAVWNDSSAADKLTVTGDGKYQFVFDAMTALGEPILSVESLQIVFPGLSETTTTVVELLGAKTLTNADDISFFSTGKVEE